MAASSPLRSCSIRFSSVSALIAPSRTKDRLTPETRRRSCRHQQREGDRAVTPATVGERPHLRWRPPQLPLTRGTDSSVPAGCSTLRSVVRFVGGKPVYLPPAM